MNEKEKIFPRHVFARPKKVSPCGCKVRKTWKLKLNDRNVKCPVCTGEYDQYEYIQSFAADADLRVLIAKFLNGDPSIPNRPWVAGTMNNTDLRSICDSNIRLQTAYNTLSDEVKAKCSYDAFVNLLGSPEGLKSFVASKFNNSEVNTDEH